MNKEHIKCLIIGSGPAGYTAAIYASRAGLGPVLFEGLQPGGQLTTTTTVENFPGYPQGVGGKAMMEDLRQQAERFGTEVRNGTIATLDLSHRPFKAVDDRGNAKNWSNRKKKNRKMDGPKADHNLQNFPYQLGKRLAARHGRVVLPV